MKTLLEAMNSLKENENSYKNDAKFIVKELKSKVLHPSDYKFKISNEDSFIGINNKTVDNMGWVNNCWVEIKDDFYNFYGTWKYGRSGYGYQGLTFKESNINKFIDELVDRLNKRFYKYETEPYKSNAHLKEIEDFVNEFSDYFSISSPYAIRSKDDFISRIINKAIEKDSKLFDKLIKKYNINMDSDWKTIKGYMRWLRS